MGGFYLYYMMCRNKGAFLLISWALISVYAEFGRVSNDLPNSVALGQRQSAKDVAKQYQKCIILFFYCDNPELHAFQASTEHTEKETFATHMVDKWSIKKLVSNIMCKLSKWKSILWYNIPIHDHHNWQGCRSISYNNIV